MAQKNFITKPVPGWSTWEKDREPEASGAGIGYSISRGMVIVCEGAKKTASVGIQTFSHQLTAKQPSRNFPDCRELTVFQRGVR